MTFIDLRSDTVTKPNAAMRKAMAEAEVGDDVYGEDPTVNLLEQRAAELFGKEAALFVPTGTMGNTIAVKVHTTHGQEVICEARSHVLDWELAMMAWFSGCLARAVPADEGILAWDQIRPWALRRSVNVAPPGLICIENTHNMAGGTVYPLDAIREICDGAHEAGLPVHMDGARIFNAAAYSKRSVRDICSSVDTVMFCLSKGLGAPAGSMLLGTAEKIERGRSYRKRLGGGMRQAGILAAAGLIALERMPARLYRDHENAALLAEGIASVGGLRIVQREVQTNIVLMDVNGAGLTAPQVSRTLRERGVLANPINETCLRLVTHMDVSRADCETALAVIREVAAPSAAL